MGMYLSYAIVMACVLRNHLIRDIELGRWNFGKRAGLVVNALGFVNTVYATIWLPFPNYLPVTATNMNYSGPVLLGVLILAGSLWFLRARTQWEGPNRIVVDFVLGNKT